MGRWSGFFDAGQALPDSLSQRIRGRQDALAACSGPAEQRLCVFRQAHRVVQMRQVRHTGQRVRVVGPENPLGIRAALPEELHGGRHPSGRLRGGGQARAGREGIRMIAPEYLPAVTQHLLVVRYGVPYLAFGQAGGGEPVPDGHGPGIARAVQALTIRQAARQQPAGRHDIAGGLVGGGEPLPGAEGIRVAGPVVLLAFADGPEQDAHRVSGLASHDEGLGQAGTSRRDGGVPGRELAALLGQHPLVPQHGLVGVPGRQVRGGQPGGYEPGVRVAGYQLGVAASGQVPPVGQGRPDQTGLVEALADPQ
jgi:hypothetical protein